MEKNQEIVGKTLYNVYENTGNVLEQPVDAYWLITASRAVDDQDRQLDAIEVEVYAPDERTALQRAMQLAGSQRQYYRVRRIVLKKPESTLNTAVQEAALNGVR